VTEYVREQMNRADRLSAEGEGRRGNTVGFALTILQRRLASSPEAIYQSLKRRRERLEKRLREERLMKRGADVLLDTTEELALPVDDDIDEFFDDAPAEEVERIEEEIVDRASAARNIAELEAEIRILRDLESLAYQVRCSGKDAKWGELSKLLHGEGDTEAIKELFNEQGHLRKLIIFTEHRDTLNYLAERIRFQIGREEAVVIIHGGTPREQRRIIQEKFQQHRDVQILVATDAAGEGINLQRAHLMVNYDLPWNPNRIEQRFGRIHRIGQNEVCHLWNLVANETREGDVFDQMLKKLEQERKALGGKVFDVLGKSFDQEPLRDLLIEAIRYGDRPEVRMRLTQVIDQALDRNHLLALIEERALAHETLTAARVQQIREDMERAAARRLQPHFIASFFREALTRLGGSIREREPRRYEITHVPAPIRNRDRIIGTGEPVLSRYERITFEKNLISIDRKPPAAFVCPGHPLLDATIDLILERYRDLLKRGAILVDPNNLTDDVRVLFFLEHSIQDARTNRDGNRRVVSRRMQFIEIDREFQVRNAGYAPYLDYRLVADEERELISSIVESDWLRQDIESKVTGYAIENLVPNHFDEVKTQKEELIQKTKAAVQDRLTKEIAYWDHRAEELKAQELAGKPLAKMNSGQARRRADELEARLRQRMDELEQESLLSPLPPVVIGGAIVVPESLISKLKDQHATLDEPSQAERERIDRLAMDAVMAKELELGRNPRMMPHNNPGYDIESVEQENGKLVFIEVKGKAVGSTTVTISRTQVLTALNKPDEFILAIVEVDRDKVSEPYYIRRPFQKEPDFSVTSINYDLKQLLALAEPAG